MKLTSCVALLALISISVQAQEKQKGAKMKEKTAEVLKSKQGRQIIHEQLSSLCFNKTWEYIAKKDLSKDDIEDMIATCYASLWHWKQRQDCKAKNLSIAYWQLGRVNCLAQKNATAKEFAERCLKVSLEAKLDAFYVAYAYEALLNAALLQKDKKAAEKYLKLANEQLKLVKNKENQAYLKADLAKLKILLDKLT